MGIKEKAEEIINQNTNTSSDLAEAAQTAINNLNIQTISSHRGPSSQPLRAVNRPSSPLTRQTVAPLTPVYSLSFSLFYFIIYYYFYYFYYFYLF